MIVEQRTYTMHPLQTGKWLKLYEEYALPIQQKHLGKLIGFFQTEIGPLNQVTHLWAYEDLAERSRCRAAMAADPGWGEYLKRSEALGAIRDQETRILVPTSFSPLR